MPYLNRAIRFSGSVASEGSGFLAVEQGSCVLAFELPDGGFFVSSLGLVWVVSRQCPGQLAT